MGARAGRQWQLFRHWLMGELMAGRQWREACWLVSCCWVGGGGPQGAVVGVPPSQYQPNPCQA